MRPYKHYLEKKRGKCLLLIDPQVDFVSGSLRIEGAVDDESRTALFINNNSHTLDDIYVTLDTHQNFHIAHPMFWKDREGCHPRNFTKISLDDFKNRTWSPVYDSMSEWCFTYLSELERLNRFNLTIWPPHCLLGTPGHCVTPEISQALDCWESQKKSAVEYTMKGMNSLTEHYSAFKAEVVRQDDLQTQLNTTLINALNSHEKVFIAGQALSHCVNFTCRDLIEHWKGNNENIVFIEDCSSSVLGFDQAGEKFLKYMKEKGVSVCSSWELV